MIGFGEPRRVKAGVVSGSFFDVMGLRPVLGRLINASDDGPDAAGVAVLTYRFWSTSLNSDPTVIGKTIRLGSRTATVVGVLEPSVPVSGRHRDHREHRDEPASSRRDDGDAADASHDGALRPACAGRHGRSRRAPS